MRAWTATLKREVEKDSEGVLNRPRGGMLCPAVDFDIAKGGRLEPASIFCLEELETAKQLPRGVL